MTSSKYLQQCNQFRSWRQSWSWQFHQCWSHWDQRTSGHQQCWLQQWQESSRWRNSWAPSWSKCRSSVQTNVWLKKWKVEISKCWGSFDLQITCGNNSCGCWRESKVLNGSCGRSVILEASRRSGKLMATIVVGHLDVPLSGGCITRANIDIDCMAIAVSINNHCNHRSMLS